MPGVGQLGPNANGGAAADARAPDKRGKLWRGGSRFGVPTGQTGHEMQRAVSAKDQRSFSPPPRVPLDKPPPARAGDGEPASGLWRRRNARKMSNGSVVGAEVGESHASGVQDTVASENGAGRGSSKRRPPVTGPEPTLGQRRGRQFLQHRRSAQAQAQGKTRRGWRRASEPTVLASLSPTPRNSQLWPRGEGREPKHAETLPRAKSGSKPVHRMNARSSSAGGRLSGATNGPGGVAKPCPQEEKEWETVAKPPSWLEDVSSSATYEEMKPALDVIKRTVLLAVLQQVRGRAGRDGTPEARSSTLDAEACSTRRVIFFVRRLREHLSLVPRRCVCLVDCARRLVLSSPRELFIYPPPPRSPPPGPLLLSHTLLLGDLGARSPPGPLLRMAASIVQRLGIWAGIGRCRETGPNRGVRRYGSSTRSWSGKCKRSCRRGGMRVVTWTGW